MNWELDKLSEIELHDLFISFLETTLERLGIMYHFIDTRPVKLPYHVYSEYQYQFNLAEYSHDEVGFKNYQILMSNIYFDTFDELGDNLPDNMTHIIVNSRKIRYSTRYPSEFRSCRILFNDASRNEILREKIPWK